MVRVGSRVYHKVFGAGNITAIYDGYTVVKFDNSGKRAVIPSSLSERPIEKEIFTYNKTHGNFHNQQIVYHRTYGKGVIKDLTEGYAVVIFDDYGEKKMNYDSLSINAFSLRPKIIKDIEEEKTDKVRVSNLDIIECIIDYMRSQKITSIAFDECIKITWNSINTSIQKVFIKNSLDPIKDKVYLVHILKRQSKIYKKYLSEIYVTLDKTMQAKTIASANKTNENILDDFERAALKEPFTSSIKMYFSRAIIKFCLETKISDNNFYKFRLDDLTKDIMLDFLYQISVGDFYNQLGKKRQPSFYDLIVASSENTLTDDERKRLFHEVRSELEFYYIRNFVLSNLENIYVPYEDCIVFTKAFVTKMQEVGKSLDVRIINRLCYFLGKINTGNSSVKAYESNIKRGLDKKKFISKFGYDENLRKLTDELDKDIYIKNEFKGLMKKYGIPPNDTYLGMCLDRINYSLKTKRIILNSRYPSLKAYYKEEILKDEVYRYTNPLNLDEYDAALKSLQNDLIIIEVGSGVYLTRTNMEKNGIDDDTIRSFHSEIETIGNELKFFSCKEIIERLPTNPIVEYCDGDKKQLIQFIKPVPNIKIINIGKKGIIISFTNSKKYRGEFIEFIMSQKESMDLYEIKDSVESMFDVEYSLDEIIKDVSQTAFYYSEEMEKVYKHKEDYIKEVFYDGN